MPRIPFAELKAEFCRVLISRGCDQAAAELSARLLSETSCDGVYSHGANRFPRVIEYIDKGFIDLKARPSKVEGIGACERWDGHLGLGNVNAHTAMARAIELAKAYGIACVALGNTNHWLRGGSYGWQAADAGCVGICWTNTLPNMPAWGACDRRIGNNPLVIAIPRSEGHVVVDMAMAQYSYGQMESVAMRGGTLPLPGGYDGKGELSCDPVAIAGSGRVLPIGYWKGSSLAMALDLVAAILSGGRSTLKIGELGGDEYGLSQVFIAIDATSIAGEAFMATAINAVLDDVRASERVDPAQAVRYPGEKSLATRRDNLAHGIPVADEVWTKIRAL